METTKITTLLQDIRSLRRVGLDTMCFIYQFADHPIYGPMTNIIFDLLEQGKLSAATSTVSVVETLVAPEKIGDWTAVNEYENVFLHYPNLEVIPLDWHVARLASKIKARNDALRLPDAVQLAVAILAECDVFITNDKKLAHVKDIRVMVLDTYG